MKNFIGIMLIVGLCCLQAVPAQAASPHFDTINGHKVLMVNNKPFLLLSVEGRQAVKQGTQADVLADMDWAVNNYCNSYKANIVWTWMETSQNVYDWTFLDQLINTARSNNIKIHLVYSGFNHCADADPQVPAYISNDKATYQPIVDANGNYVYVRPNRTDHQLCPNDPETLDREKKMVAAMMAHLRVIDSVEQMVVMVQNQNEPHVRQTLRCHCPVCNNLYAAGSWSDEERFHAYSLAKYIEELTIAGKAEYDIPFNINALIEQSGPHHANAYRYLQLYLDTALHIDLIGPDQYSYNIADMRSMLNQFKIGRKIIYLPETTTDGFVTKTAEFFIYQVLGEFGGIGQSPWSVHVPFPNANTSTPYDQGSQAGIELGKAYKAIKDAMSPIATYQTTNKLAWFVPNGASSFTRTVNTATLNITTANDHGKGIIVQPQSGVMDFTLVGNDYSVSLPDLSQGNTIVVEQGRWDDTQWLKTQNISFSASGGKVTITMPLPCAVRVFSAQAQGFPLASGWNWISFNRLPADLSLNSVFADILSPLSQVKTQTQSAMRIGGAWKGDLADMSGIGQYKMYKVKVTQASILTVTGTVIPPTTPIQLQTGWNWVVFLPTTPMSIATALSSISGQVQEVKSRTQSATYNGSVWNGTLSQLEPGQGYAIKMNTSGTLTYPADASTQIIQQGRNQ
jgi:hypothetical protein